MLSPPATLNHPRPPWCLQGTPLPGCVLGSPSWGPPHPHSLTPTSFSSLRQHCPSPEHVAPGSTSGQEAGTLPTGLGDPPPLYSCVWGASGSLKPGGGVGSVPCAWKETGRGSWGCCWSHGRGGEVDGVGCLVVFACVYPARCAFWQAASGSCVTNLRLGPSVL